MSSILSPMNVTKTALGTEFLCLNTAPSMSRGDNVNHVASPSGDKMLVSFLVQKVSQDFQFQHFGCSGELFARLSASSFPLTVAYLVVFAVKDCSRLLVSQDTQSLPLLLAGKSQTVSE